MGSHHNTATINLPSLLPTLALPMQTILLIMVSCVQGKRKKNTEEQIQGVGGKNDKCYVREF